MKRERTAFVKAASDQGCRIQVGTDMLFEQIPAYLGFLGLPSTTPQVLRSLSRLQLRRQTRKPMQTFAHDALPAWVMHELAGCGLLQSPACVKRCSAYAQIDTP